MDQIIARTTMYLTGSLLSNDTARIVEFNNLLREKTQEALEELKNLIKKNETIN